MRSADCKENGEAEKRTRLLLVQTISTGESEEHRQLSKVFTGPGIKKQLPSNQGEFYLQQELVMKLLDFESDEKSIKSQTYAMGLPLYRLYSSKRMNKKPDGMLKSWQSSSDIASWAASLIQERYLAAPELYHDA